MSMFHLHFGPCIVSIMQVCFCKHSPGISLMFRDRLLENYSEVLPCHGFPYVLVKVSRSQEEQCVCSYGCRTIDIKLQNHILQPVLK